MPASGRLLRGGLRALRLDRVRFGEAGLPGPQEVLDEDADGRRDDGAEDRQEDGARVLEPRGRSARCVRGSRSARASPGQRQVTSRIDVERGFRAAAEIALDAPGAVVTRRSQADRDEV